MTKKVKITNTKEKEILTPTILFDEYFCMQSWRMKPYTEEYVNEKAKQLLDWAFNNPEALKISLWTTKEGMCGETIAKWQEKYPQWKRAYRLAKQVIGDRREIGGLRGDLNGMLVEKTMAMYDHEYAQETERRAALTKQDNDDAKVFNLVLTAAPTTDLVPLKKTENTPLPFRDSDDKQAKD